MARGVGRWAIERRARATESHPAGEWEIAPLGRFGSRERAQRVIDRIVPHDDMHDFRAREIGGAPVYVPEAQRSPTAGKVGSIRMPADAWARLDAYAAQLGVGRGAAVAALLAELERSAG